MWQFYRLVIFVALFLVTAPQSVNAAHLYLDSGDIIHGSLDTFYIPVRVDTNGECINAVNVTLVYNPEEISIKDILTGDSILTLWTQTPLIKRDSDDKEVGAISFTGGIPGGYCGRVIGDPGKTNILLKLVISSASKDFFDEKIKKTQIIVDPSTKVYLNDGKGTEAKLTVLGADLLFVKSTSTPKNLWMDDIKLDTIAPQLFEITLIKGPSDGNARSYIIFNTTDKQSGIDHYEVLETDPDKFGFLSWLPNESYWITAKSPYILRDQKLRSKIMVKAIDKNGNERVVEYTPLMSLLSEITHPSLLLPIIVIVIVIMFFLVIILKIKKRKEKLILNNGTVEDNIKEHKK